MRQPRNLHSMPAKWASGSFFIPAQDSRHRTACLALYRALLALTPKISLPVSLSTAWGPKRDPIAHLIWRAFVRNRPDTSPRLVYPALRAGYRMLDTLSRAADPESPEYASILSFLQERLKEREHTLAMKKIHPLNSRNPPKPSSAPNPKSVPLLVRTTPAPTSQNPNPKVSYAAAQRPRPRSDLPPGGRRHVPVLDMASDFPILRISKPQPRILSRVLTQKIRKRTERQAVLTRMYEEGLSEAEEEDAWERRIVRLLKQEVLEKGARKRRIDGGGSEGRKFEVEHRELDDSTAVAATNSGYQQTIWRHGISAIMDMLAKEREDSVARADAMRALVAEESALAQQEKKERAEERRKRWEAGMLDKHGQGWGKITEEETRERDQARAERMAKPKEIRDAEEEAYRAEKAAAKVMGGREAVEYWTNVHEDSRKRKEIDSFVSKSKAKATAETKAEKTAMQRTRE
ncbi:hypothetical protein BJ170DRAFT_177424 [Xylariales sp. AK1849]|nr:hypothetical protein BJ170DRAFT_177424 [Xylariales sp. AK1849]